MKKAYWESAAGIAIAGALFLSGLAFAYVFKLLPKHPGDSATWAGALLAGLAFSGTIYLAISDRRKRNADALVLAELTARSVYLRIAHMQVAMATVVEWLETASHIDQDLIGFKTCADHLIAERLWRVSEIEPLAALPNQSAILLASIADEIASSITLLSNSVRNSKLADSMERRDFAIDMHDATLNSMNAITECLRLLEPYCQPIKIET